MMKNMLIAAVTAFMMVVLSPLATRAQEAKESMVRYRKADRSGVVATYNYDEDAVRGALLKKLETAGLKDKKVKKGFYVFSGVNWNDIMPEKVDVYVRVDGNSSKANAYILIAKGYDNYISSTTDPDAIEKLKNMLNTLGADIEEYKKAQALAAQQAAVAAAEADAKKAQREAERAAKRKAKAEARNAREQKKLEEQQRKLSQMGGQ